MIETPPASALTSTIKRDLLLYGKLCELRREVVRWLGYVSATFPHYTSHTIDHSDEIVNQISLLLFRDNRSFLKPALTSLESYALVCAAYLHDAGMVASDHEKRSLFSSTEWQEWTTSGSGAARWSKILARRAIPTTRPEDNYDGDVETR